ncbi:hypothetical protein NQ314_012170 [Rhamnusium bicolor]|uniref:Ionotropic receptor 75a N-terminal domain-containing protein n=1 Tax=Rhamnusium bicolor TaxID=1586634 RepID=A0AAV8XFF6_9CUCU|nr:hypothetical protein NQ314_012170 [Rhamnusium bicolor]
MGHMKKLISEHNKIRLEHNWLMIAKSNILNSDIRNLFKNIKLRMDTNIKIAIPKIDHNQCDIYEIYDPGLEADIKINKIGLDSYGNLTYFNKNISFYESRKNMTGVLIRAGDRVNYTFSSTIEILNELRHRELGTFGKFHFQLFLILLNIHNFHYNTTIRTDWFGNSSSGIEAGISQSLYQNQIDISSAGGILRAARMHFYDYLLPYYKFRSCFFFRNPGIREIGTDVLKPFSLKTWYYTLGAIFLTGMATKAAYWVDQRFLNSNMRYTFFTSFLITISILTQQGT